MKAKQRAAVAEIIMALTNDGRIKNVYSYELATYISLSGTAEKSYVNAYDYSRSCHITGNSNNGKQYSLYDYGTSCHISLTVNGKTATGYDYGSGYHFSCSVSNRSASIYDYETGQHYNYSC